MSTRSHFSTLVHFSGGLSVRSSHLHAYLVAQPKFCIFTDPEILSHTLYYIIIRPKLHFPVGNLHLVAVHCGCHKVSIPLPVSTCLSIDDYRLSVWHLDCIIVTTFSVFMYLQFCRLLVKRSGLYFQDQMIFPTRAIYM